VNHFSFTSAFVNFGPGALGPLLTDVQHISGNRPAALRRAVREACSRKPGVYGMLDAHGELIYIGKAKSLRLRLLSYFRPGSRDRKATRIIGQAHAIVWEVSASEFGALHRELELIRRWRPRWNVQGQPHRGQFTYVCVGRPPAPQAFLARRPPRHVVACFGPVSAGNRAVEAVRRVNDWFQLRDCPQVQEMLFAEQRELFPALHGAGCLRYEIGTCLAPCMAACSQRAYAARVRQAKAFLAGTDLRPLELLEKEMTAAAAAQNFERAAGLRDRLSALRWLHEQLTRMRQAQAEGAVVYPVTSHDGRLLWYLIRAGRTVSVVAAPCCPETSALAAARLEEVYGADLRGGETPVFEHLAGVFLVASWFRRRPEERARALTPAQARALCRPALRSIR
jgi:excinuclease ABC subunit C